MLKAAQDFEEMFERYPGAPKHLVKTVREHLDEQSIESGQRLHDAMIGHAVVDWAASTLWDENGMPHNDPEGLCR